LISHLFFLSSNCFLFFDSVLVGLALSTLSSLNIMNVFYSLFQIIFFDFSFFFL